LRFKQIPFTQRRAIASIINSEGYENKVGIFNKRIVMKIIIFNEELRSQMQMYLALHLRHEVEIAEDKEALLKILNSDCADVTFLDLNYSSEEHNGESGVKLAQQVRRKYPNLRVIGIHNGHDSSLENKAQKIGLNDLITRPIKNRQLMKALEI